MFRSRAYTAGFRIEQLTSCDFSKLEERSNEDVLRASGRPLHDKLTRFLSEEMGIERRFYAPDGINAMDLAHEALGRLLEKDPSLRDESTFFIYAGISNPMPTVCQSAYLAEAFGFKNASCWDLKSGCSTGVLALAQSLDWMGHGAERGVVVSSETFSKFTRPSALEMSASTGDGACALSLRAEPTWRVRAVVHGTDARYFRNAYVPGTYPVDVENYDPEQYRFAFGDKGETIKALQHYWIDSLQQLLKTAEVDPGSVTHYVSHQVDGTKNRAIAKACGIRDEAIALNFAQFGNMGAPTIFLNYLNNVHGHAFSTGDMLVFHAVGGGLSYAGICLEKTG